VTSSVSPDDDAAHQGVTGAAHYYASLPPQPVYFIIDQSAGLYPALTSAGTVLTTSTYVAPVPPMIAPQVQSAGMMLPPGLISAPAQTRSILAPTLLRPGLIQQTPPPGVIMPSGLIPAPPTGILPTPPSTNMMAAHAAVLPMPHSVAQVQVNELPFNANTCTTLAAGYCGLPVAADANGPLDSMPVDLRVSLKSAEHESVGCNVNNSASEPAVHSDCDAVMSVSEQTSAEFIGPADTDMSEQGNRLATYEQCNRSEAGTQFMEQSTDVTAKAAAAVNGELSVDASHDLVSSSESSSVASPSSVLADMSLNENTCERDAALSKDISHSPVMPQSTLQSSSSAAVVMPSTAVKTKAPSWASLLKDTTSATNAIVINMNENHAVAIQQKADVKSLVKEPATQQSPVSHVSNDEKLKLEVSGQYKAILLRLSL